MPPTFFDLKMEVRTGCAPARAHPRQRRAPFDPRPRRHKIDLVMGVQRAEPLAVIHFHQIAITIRSDY